MKGGVLFSPAPTPVGADSHQGLPGTACLPGDKRLEKLSGGPREGCSKDPSPGEEGAEPRAVCPSSIPCCLRPDPPPMSVTALLCRQQALLLLLCRRQGDSPRAAPGTC